MPPAAYLEETTQPSHSVGETMATKSLSVTFSDDCTYVEYGDPIPENAQKKMFWFSQKEYDLVNERNKLVVELIKVGRFEESEEFTARGMETYVEERTDLHDAFDAVLQEQYRQAVSGKISRRRVARASQCASRVHREIALQNGMQDAEEAWGIQEYATLAKEKMDDDSADFTEIREADPTAIRPVCSPQIKAKTRQKGLNMSPMKTMKRLLTNPKRLRSKPNVVKNLPLSPLSCSEEERKVGSARVLSPLGTNPRS
jgi:hypothetical protein